MLFRLTLFLTFFWIVIAPAISQILDDSTELVYGPSTVKVVYENDLKLNNDEFNEMDTSLYNLENFTYVDQNNRKYQDLGNVGTALFPVFYDLPATIGRSSGFNSYSYYYINPDTHKYYDTKSPLMDLNVVLGGHGRAVIHYGYSQNITPNWNFGINIHKMNVDKQIGADQTEGDRNVDHTSADLYTYWSHPESSYKLLAYVFGMSHKVDETGGILVSEDATRPEKFQYRDNNIRLQDARGVEGNIGYHLYHEFGVLNNLQLYHQSDANRQTYTYQDFADGTDVTYYGFYDQFLIDPDSTYQQSVFSDITNEAGLKGGDGAIHYRIYYKNRWIRHRFLYGSDRNDALENYLGAFTRFKLKEVFDVSGKGELTQTGEFKLRGVFDSKFVRASYHSVRYRQSNLTQGYFDNHNEWNNSFDRGFINSISGELKLSPGNFDLFPFAEFRTMDNYVYFDTASTPVLAGQTALFSRFGGRFNYFIKTGETEGSGFHFENEVYYTLLDESSAEFIRIPDLFYAGKYYWTGRIFNKSVPVQIGFNIYSKSGFFANDYNPVIQQYFVQNTEELPLFVTADFFLNMQIEKLSIFAKVVHANMGGEDGYFITPLYPGQERVFDFGVRWLFFD